MAHEPFEIWNPILLKNEPFTRLLTLDVPRGRVRRCVKQASRSVLVC